MKSDNAIWISPDGKKIVYATFNDSQVQSVQWKLYGDGRDANVNPYPTEAFMRYPKVCTGNALAWVQRVHKPADLWDITFCTR